jgi:carbamoyltransferase
MITWGINALNHDASIAVVIDGNLKFWERSSKYSSIPGDDKIHSGLLSDAITASGHQGPDNVVWYERPWLKKLRQFRAGQYHWAFDMGELPSRYLKTVGLGYPKISYMPHHLSHAAAGFLTSPFEEAAVVVLDAMGEWESASIWHGKGTELKKVWSRSYPTSLGLFYSAFTDLIGLKPLGEEHVLQQYSDKGNYHRYRREVESYWNLNWTLSENLHKGVRSWKDPIVTEQDKYDIAAAVQYVFENQAMQVMNTAKHLTGSENLVYMGGCAMNSKFNQDLDSSWNGVWSLPIPGDASSTIGAALYYQKKRIKWSGGLAKHVKIK